MTMLLQSKRYTFNCLYRGKKIILFALGKDWKQAATNLLSAYNTKQTKVLFISDRNPSDNSDPNNYPYRP